LGKMGSRCCVLWGQVFYFVNIKAGGFVFALGESLASDPSYPLRAREASYKILPAHRRRTLGSTMAYTKSVSKLTATYETAMIRMQPCKSG
jgi:hypothetical protein